MNICLNVLYYPVKAVLWYQGEEDSPQYMYYSELLKTLITSWRKAYDEDLPFFIIQLPEYENSHFDEIRRVQRDVVRSIKVHILLRRLKQVIQIIFIQQVKRK